MAARNFFDHTNPDGLDFVARATAAGYPNPRAENIAAGQPDPQAVMNSWLTSEGHRANILNCDLMDIGVGVGTGGQYGIYWTQVFG